MNDIRTFIKNNSKEVYKLSIKYDDTETIYKYKYPSYLLTFKEDFNENLILIINGNTYESLTDIHLFLFNLFDYKNFEYIDLYLKQQIEKTPIDIEDFYNDNYDDFNNEFIAIRNLILNKKIFKMKFVLKNNEFYLYYNLNIISGFDNIIEKIKEIIQLIMNSNQPS
jgi:hypothetical protein